MLTNILTTIAIIIVTNVSTTLVDRAYNLHLDNRAVYPWDRSSAPTVETRQVTRRVEQITSWKWTWNHNDKFLSERKTLSEVVELWNNVPTPNWMLSEVYTNVPLSEWSCTNAMLLTNAVIWVYGGGPITNIPVSLSGQRRLSR